MFEVVYIEENNRIESGLSYPAAIEKAAAYCGNKAALRLPDMTLLFGRGDGTTSVIVRPSLTFAIEGKQDA